MEMRESAGSLRMFFLYGFGVLAGSLGSSVFDTEANVVGSSGAVYALLGAWLVRFIIRTVLTSLMMCQVVFD